MTIDALITATLVREGWPAYTNDPADHGGPTKGGITIPDLEKKRERRCTAADIQNLTEAEVREVYLEQYVTEWKFDHISDPWVQEFVIDTGVLQGQGTAAKMLQRVLHVPVDADIGPTTLATLTMALHDPKALRNALIQEREHLLLDAMCTDIPVLQRQTTNLRYRHGWWNRVCGFLE